MNPISRLIRPCMMRIRMMMQSTTSIPSGPSTHTESSMDILDMDSLMDDVGRDARTSKKGYSFARLLRESKWMQLADINGRLVTARIIQRVNDDIYVDFGMKFPAVCKVPAVNSEAYRIGASVLIRLHDLELSERFLGSRKDLTLLEADATLVSLLNRSNRVSAKKKTDQQKEEVIQEA